MRCWWCDRQRTAPVFSWWGEYESASQDSVRCEVCHELLVPPGDALPNAAFLRGLEQASSAERHVEIEGVREPLLTEERRKAPDRRIGERRRADRRLGERRREPRRGERRRGERRRGERRRSERRAASG
jgi:hypothetical protein